MDVTILHHHHQVRPDQQFNTANAVFRRVILQRLFQSKKLDVNWQLTEASDKKLLAILNDFRSRWLCQGGYPKPYPNMSHTDNFVKRYQTWVDSKSWTAVFFKDCQSDENSKSQSEENLSTAQVKGSGIKRKSSPSDVTDPVKLFRGPKEARLSSARATRKGPTETQDKVFDIEFEEREIKVEPTENQSNTSQSLEIEFLRKHIERLTKQNDELINEKGQLKVENRELKAEIEVLKSKPCTKCVTIKALFQ